MHVKVDENGTLYETCRVAGSVGIRITSSGSQLDEIRVHGDGRTWIKDRGTGRSAPYVYQPVNPSGEHALDSLQPESGWWMYELKEGNTGKSWADSMGSFPSVLVCMRDSAVRMKILTYEKRL